MKPILFASALDTSFIQDDYEILSRYFPVYKVISSGLMGLAKMLRHLFKVQLTFIWFATYHSGVIVFLSKLLCKKTIIVLGGFDVAKEKDIEYGVWNSWWRSLFVGYAIRNADYILTTSKVLKKSAEKLMKDSIQAIEVLGFTYDCNFWQQGSIVKEKFVLTVATISNEVRFKVKGIDQLIKVAKLLPRIKFKLVGVSTNFKEKLKNKISSNMELYSPLSQHKLLRFYQLAKVYCQPSRIDALPIALREAMLCGCLPVGTNVGGIPEAIGDTGWIVGFGNTEEMVEAIKAAFEVEEKTGNLCRNRILKISASVNREKRLVEIVEKCLK